jgi:hypothetical protein
LIAFPGLLEKSAHYERVFGTAGDRNTGAGHLKLSQLEGHELSAYGRESQRRSLWTAADRGLLLELSVTKIVTSLSWGGVVDGSNESLQEPVFSGPCRRADGRGPGFMPWILDLTTLPHR